MKKATLEKTLAQFREKHGDFYDYSLVEYKNNRTPVIILCPLHGEFLQSPKTHKLYGCKECGHIKQTGRPKGHTQGKEGFVKKAKAIYGDYYGYSKVVYVNSTEPVIIECPVHGDYLKTPHDHLKRGCRLCGIEATASKRRGVLKLTTEDCLERYKEVHGDRYDYSKMVFKGTGYKITIICRKHGEFKQRPYDHYIGRGCPRCKSIITKSKQEKELSNFLRQFVPIKDNDRILLGAKRELDIYIPSRNLAVEFNGLFWHSEYYKDKYYHLTKYQLCLEKGIQLIQIWEDDWEFKQDIVKSYLKSKLGIYDRKLNARECGMREVSSVQAKVFLNSNHIQGSVRASKFIGLFYGEELVSLMSFKRSGGGIWDLSRFCSALNTSVRGSFTKLLTNFIREENPNEIFSFSDNTYSNGKLYEVNGFDLVKELPPDYKYLVGKRREHKFKYRKKALQKMFENTEGKTEREITLENKLYRIYDAGKKKYNLKP